MKRMTLGHLVALFLLIQIPGPLQAQDSEALLASAAELLSRAGSLMQESRYSEAEELLQQVLSIQESVRGSYHPDLAITLIGLGGALGGQGRYEESERVHRRAL